MGVGCLGKAYAGGQWLPFRCRADGLRRFEMAARPTSYHARIPIRQEVESYQGLPPEAAAVVSKVDSRPIPARPEAKLSTGKRLGVETRFPALKQSLSPTELPSGMAAIAGSYHPSGNAGISGPASGGKCVLLCGSVKGGKRGGR